jgi:hypothetical protein
MSQLWESLLHRSGLQQQMWDVINGNSAHTIAPLERSDDIRHTQPHGASGCGGGIDDNGKCRPDIQHFCDWTSVCATKFQIQPTWRSKHDRSPFSAHVH